MKKAVEKLNEELEESRKKEDMVDKTLTNLCWLFSTPFPTNVQEVIDDLKGQKKELRKRIHKLQEAIQALKNICGHNWEYWGHDSHNNYDKCTICGEIR